MANMMLDVLKETRCVVSQALKKLPIDEKISYADIQLETSLGSKRGDFSTNTAMRLAGVLKKTPRQTAEMIVDNMDVKDTYIEKVEVSDLGFINFYLKEKWFFDTLKAIQVKEKKNETTKICNNENGLDFDFVMGKWDESPTFYVQYIHARICRILKLLENEGRATLRREWIELSLLGQDEETKLIKKLVQFPQVEMKFEHTQQRDKVEMYAYEVASMFYSFYHECGIRDKNSKLMDARIILVEVTGIVLQNVLKMIGASMVRDVEL